MVSDLKEVKQANKAAKKLVSLRAHQAKRVHKLAHLRDRLEVRARKLHALEAEMAYLERRAYGGGLNGLGPALRPAWLVVNPNCGGLRTGQCSVERLTAALRAHGLEPQVHLKDSGKDARAWVRSVVADGADLVIAAGGDGTLGDVASQLVNTSVVFGILPIGTMNNVARELGIPLELDQACALIGAGITRPLDVGRIWSDEHGQDEYFLETAGVGLAVALPAGQNVKKGRWGRLPKAFRAMFAAGTDPIYVELDGGEVLETKVHLVTVSNAPLYALNNLIAPDAKMDDGLLDVAIYDGMSDLELAAYFLKTAKGTRVANPNVRFFHARHVQIRSERDLPVVTDNNEAPVCHVIDLEVLPRALQAIVGRGPGLSWPVEAVPAVPPLAGAQGEPKTDPVVATNGHQPAPAGTTAEAPEQPPAAEMVTAGGAADELDAAHAGEGHS